MANLTRKVFWNLINSLIAGSLVIIGSLTDGEVTSKGLMIAIVAGTAIFLSQFRDFWAKEEQEFTAMPMFKFI
jgi:hypothetical protein